MTTLFNFVGNHFKSVCLILFFKQKPRPIETGGKKDSVQITNLKKYIRMCGLFKNYKVLFQDCRSEKAKVTILKDILKEAGIQGIYHFNAVYDNLSFIQVDSQICRLIINKLFN